MVAERATSKEGQPSTGELLAWHSETSRSMDSERTPNMERKTCTLAGCLYFCIIFIMIKEHLFGRGSHELCIATPVAWKQPSLK